MKRLLLVGGGHAHVAVLSALARRPMTGWDVQLVTPFARQIYSGMLPGWIAGHHPLEAGTLPVDRLAAAAGVAWHPTSVEAVDVERRIVRGANAREWGYDLVSFNVGSASAADRLPGAREHALPLRPLEGFVAAWPALVDRLLGICRRFDLVIVGGGAAGVELAFAIQHRAMTDGWSHLRITIVGAEARVLDGLPEGARVRAGALLAQRGIRWLGSHRVDRIEAGRLVFADGRDLAFDSCLLATGAAPPAWLRDSALALDDRGFLRVTPALQSVSHPDVLAAGDVASLASQRPKSGVYAVRAGPVLARNLRALGEGRPPEAWQPQRRALYLVSTGDRGAIGVWGDWSWSGCWAWHWKSRLDRSFVRRFSEPV